MAIRLIEIVFNAEHKDRILEALEEPERISELQLWQLEVEEGRYSARLLLNVEESEDILEILNKRFGLSNDDNAENGCRVVIYPVTATLPRLKEPEDADATEDVADQASPGETSEEHQTTERISREELYQTVLDGAALSRIYLALCMLSSLVAAIGMLKDNLAVVIGAMVIAPLLGPNVGLSLATTLADRDLGKVALRSLTIGITSGFFVAFLVGVVGNVDGEIPTLQARLAISLADIVLALASGVAGMLSYLSGLPAALVGVMVALSLVPPLAAAGMLLGDGQFVDAGYALLLLATNIICLNLAGVGTFVVFGIRPYTWWEEAQAKRAVRRALIIWTGLLLLLAGLIYFLGGR